MEYYEHAIGVQRLVHSVRRLDTEAKLRIYEAIIDQFDGSLFEEAYNFVWSAVVESKHEVIMRQCAEGFRYVGNAVAANFYTVLTPMRKAHLTEVLAKASYGLSSRPLMLVGAYPRNIYDTLVAPTIWFTETDEYT